MSMHDGFHRAGGAARARGFNLVELMVAIALGILIGLGLVMLFDATSKTNHVQEAMAEMQENGRFAMTRLNDDLRLASRQLMNSTGYSDPAHPNTALTLAANVYVASVPFPDGALTPPASWPAMTSSKPWWPLSPTYFVVGNNCTTSCTPSTVPAYIPAMGTAAGNRVQNADVLTVRYLNSAGWTSTIGDSGGVEVTANCAGANLTNLAWHQVTQTSGGYTYTTAPLTLVTGQLALLADSSGNLEIFPVTVSVSGSNATITPTAAQINSGGSVACEKSGELKLFNFTKDFVTVTYWLRLDADPNVAGRLIPALMRTQADNSGAPGAGATHTDTELVQGVEQMDFLFGFQEGSGNVQFLTADKVAGTSSSATCTPPPGQYINANAGYEATCLWRSLSSIEVHFLIDSVNNLYTLTAPEQVYSYNGATNLVPVASPGKMPSGLDAGAMMRREFISLVSVRNYNS
ncbi:MAG TPA: PilW family protein [Rudaea sp.]|nr:PilW family protein [Rudaea sp.]